MQPVSSRSSSSWNREYAELEYKPIQTELRLARAEQLYLVLNFKRNELQLKLKGATVWNCPIEIAQPDSQELREFLARFLGDERRVMLPLSDKYLFAGRGKTPDSVLAVVGEVANVDPELLQRDVPARFQLIWDHGLTVEIRTEIPGKPRLEVKRALVELRHALRRPFGEAWLTLKMNPDEALTLYRAARPGMPTLLFPRE
ncbi:MAG: hypothetical protein WBF13_08150 [Candidatus Zixiibacteriota bacterium]